MASKVVFLGMGGTIAGRAADASDNVGYRAGEVAVDELLRAVAGLPALLAGHELASEQVAQLDSKDMAFDDMARLAARVQAHLLQPQVAAVVVTHGTDTLEETAFFLARVLPQALLRTKPVVMTCAMRPATAMAPDGPANLLDAVALALEPSARGVLVSCAGSIHSALHVQKVHPYRLDAFSSGEAGPLAVMEEGRVRWLALPESALLPVDKPDKAWHLDRLGPEWPRVEIVLNHAHTGGALVRALCRTPQPEDAPVQGLVVAGTGNGTLNHALEAALLEAQASGVRVVRVSRCALGAVVVAREATGSIPAMPYSAVKARIALVLDLLAAQATA